MFGSLGRRNGSPLKLAALDALRTNVMIADNNLTIVYMNPAVEALLKEAEADLQKELPRFSMKTLLGSNIDIFHKNPSHQRKMLATLEKPHAATIRVGSRAFDLRVAPLRHKGEKLGYVVEWADAKHRLLNFDYAAKFEAISRSQAVIEFTTDGTIVDANANFLKTMDYSIEEIRGRKHSMFVEPAYRDSREYQEFWDKLRRGEYHAAQFKRIGRNGKVVWIEGSYNPILDERGQVAKVVKFASDVTAQMALLSNLKNLIDHNFHEIDGAVHQSDSGTTSASRAAEETSQNVQMVAASAEELAASIAEIARNMEKSRSATTHAFNHASSVSESTARMNNAAQAMTGVASIIQGIAGQINLLALNATIEAARAGDAGKGFAVVASEVKNLANQAARATEQITQEIEGIQVTSAQVSSAISTIRDAIETLNEQVSVTASAVEEQNVVTRSMSSNMQRASSAVRSVSSSIADISLAVNQVGQAVSKTKEAAKVLVR
ncbi:PAS domain-containing methyl-accepting chemotaxis protein [Roseomonas sp. E05]|uniref:methyl-accepting chemotaxis protein n=1 Tax=Roseomonas sp. E05 TaxID=3046310 RepID=UPI0024B9844F|nr:PAS domain-containing methyl-accepting chemotaxis protein [Roseomonas sp. E05]MDJ0387979.1 PAS domain-containing methyl-accepting chemotaxis protein [Roseomonas sp. E05]